MCGWVGGVVGRCMLWGPPSLLSSGASGSSTGRVKWLAYEADNTLGAEVKNIWHCTR